MFCSSVYHLLEEGDREDMINFLNGSWSLAATSGGNPRDLTIQLFQNEEGSDAWVQVHHGDIPVPFVFDLRHDRISKIHIEKQSNGMGGITKFSIERFRKDVLPVLRKMLCNCFIYCKDIYFWGQQPFSTDNRYSWRTDILANIIYEEFNDVYSFAKIDISNSGEKSHEFMKSQLQSGNVRHAIFKGEGWPQSMKELFLPFVKSRRFEALSVFRADLQIDFDVVSAVFDRFFNGEKRKGRWTPIMGRTSFPLTDLSKLYSEIGLFAKDFPCSTTVWTLDGISGVLPEAQRVASPHEDAEQPSASKGFCIAGEEFQPRAPGPAFARIRQHQRHHTEALALRVEASAREARRDLLVREALPLLQQQDVVVAGATCHFSGFVGQEEEGYGTLRIKNPVNKNSDFHSVALNDLNRRQHPGLITSCVDESKMLSLGTTQKNGSVNTDRSVMSLT
uniref:Calpain catalytic domain-containing protein n=1 Tax=Steinernema glaseri TaxID=37863 RepID=A0A1I7Y103_9BILA